MYRSYQLALYCGTSKFHIQISPQVNAVVAMKIQLERKLYPCRDKLHCTVCQQMFNVGQIRSLLHRDSGFLQGDICPKCAKLTAQDFKQKMVLNARILLHQANLRESQTITLHEQALELLETSKENVKFPTFWQHLLMQVDVLAQDTQELEAAKFGLQSGSDRQRLQRRLFLDDDHAQN